MGANEDKYKSHASKGMDLLIPVSIHGKTHRDDVGVEYHTSVKLFDPSKDDKDKIHEKAKTLDFTPPDPKEVGIEPSTIRSHDGYDMHVLKLYGPHADRIKANNKQFEGQGYPQNYEFSPHITVDKHTWDGIRAQGHKTAADAHIEFKNAELRHGTTMLQKYHARELKRSEQAPTLRKSMQLTPNEIDTVENAGTLNGSPVKLLKTKGGFWIAIGRPKGKMTEEALAAGSHPAIVKFNVERQFPDFQPSMMKSELFTENVKVEKYSELLSEDLVKSGHDMYALRQGSKVEFQITKHNAKVASVSGYIDKDALTVSCANAKPEFVNAFSKATVKHAVDCRAAKVRIQGK